MFEALAQVIEELEIPPCGDAIVEAIAWHDRLGAAICEAAGGFDADGRWQIEGATSMTAWLRHHGRMAPRDAKRLSCTARRLRQLPATAAAYAAGTLSSGQVAAIVANLSDATVPMFAEQEVELIPCFAPLSVGDLARAMQEWKARAESLLPDEKEPAEPERSLHHSETLDGRWATDGSFDPEGGAVIDAGLHLATTPDVEGVPPRSPAQRRADAMVAVFRWFLDHQDTQVSERRRPHLNVVIDFADLLNGREPERPHKAGGAGSLLDGTRLDAVTLRRLLCDAGVHRVITAGRSDLLDYGRTTRTVPASLWAAVVLRDRHCRFPGCDRRPGWCEVHHVVPWQEGGPTSLANSALACTRHHHVLHLPGWEAKLLPNGDFHVTTPEGRVLIGELPP